MLLGVCNHLLEFTADQGISNTFITFFTYSSPYAFYLIYTFKVFNIYF